MNGFRKHPHGTARYPQMPKFSLWKGNTMAVLAIALCVPLAATAAHYPTADSLLVEHPPAAEKRV